jgi:ABC-type lipoprotein release transport system permease subunit
MGALGWLVGKELRSRWRAVVVIGLLVGLAGGVVLTAAAGARRTGSAFERFVEVTATRDASVQVDDERDDVGVDAILDEIEDLDLVAGSGRLEIMPVLPTDESLHTDIDLAIFASPDGRWGREIDRPLVLEGRMPDPSASDEVLLNELASDQSGLSVGDRFEVATFTQDQLTALIGEGRFEGFGGPVVDLRVVGIGRQATDLAGGDINVGGVLITSPALHAELDGEAGAHDGLLGVELASGATVGELRSAVREIVGPQGSFDVAAADEDFGRSTKDAAGVLARALAAFAAVAAIAGAVAVGGAITRHCAASQPAVRMLEALGCERRERVLAGAAVPIAGALVGTVMAVVAAGVLSDRFPISVARRVEPDPGMEIDRVVFGVGSVALLALSAAWAVVTIRRLARTGAPSRASRSWTSLALPPSASIGIGHTFDRRAADRTVPVRAALAASVLGMVGVVGAATVVHSFDALVDEPPRYGWTWSVEPDTYAEDREALADEIAASPGVDAVAARHTKRMELAGSVVTGFAFESRGDVIAPPLRSGRLPDAADEVVLGQRTADDLGVSIGDRVPVSRRTGESGTVDVEVVGIAVFAPVETKDPGSGALVTPEGLERYGRSDGYTSMLVRYEPGFDSGGLEDELMEREVADFSAVYARPRLPGALENLDLVMPIVVALGAFFAALAVVGLTHALVVGTRRRRRELATLRALGMRRRQVRRIVLVTGVATVLFGVLVGVPLGLVAGRSVWALVIGSHGLLDAPTAPMPVLLAALPAAVVIALVVSWWPGTTATRRPGHVLRSE